MSAPEQEWVEHVIWWHVYPLGFVGAPIRPQDGEVVEVTHRLGRIEAWLDHLIDLGLNGLQLGPVFESSSHGYDTVDYYRVDRRLGDDHDLQQLIEAAHRRGIRVLLDGVFNHVSRRHPLFQALQAEGPGAASADLFHVDWDGWEPGGEVDAAVFEGHGELVTLNHDSPAVRELVVDVMVHWLDRGVDGWRLDAAYAVPSSFWAEVLPRVRAKHPQAWFTAEVIHGDKAEFVAETGVDSVTQYELWQGIWHSSVDGNLFELAHAIERHVELLPAFVPSTFIGNHDVTRIASAMGDSRHLPHALATLLTLAGTPGIYAGDEYGYEAVKEARVGGDDAVRPEFAPQPPDQLSAREREVQGLTHDLVALRRSEPWLHAAYTDILERADDSLSFRTARGADAVVTALNIGDDAVELPIGDASAVIAGAGEIRRRHVRLDPHGWAILR